MSVYYKDLVLFLKKEVCLNCIPLHIKNNSLRTAAYQKQLTAYRCISK